MQSTATYTITDADVENLTLLGTANINGTGNGSANVITGNAGNNVLNGAGGSRHRESYATCGGCVSRFRWRSTAQQNTGGAVIDTLSNFENLTGSAFRRHADGGNTAANVLSERRAATTR